MRNVFFLVVLAMWCAFSCHWLQEVSAPPDITSLFPAPPGAPVTDLETRQDFLSAVWEWERALRLTIPIPDFYWSDNPDDCLGNPPEGVVLACADTESYRITLINTQAWWTYPVPVRQRLLAHEVGHLLGVPHIEEDSLMSAGLNKSEDYSFLSPFSIAIAREALRLNLDDNANYRAHALATAALHGAYPPILVALPSGTVEIPIERLPAVLEVNPCSVKVLAPKGQIIKGWC